MGRIIKLSKLKPFDVFKIKDVRFVMLDDCCSYFNGVIINLNLFPQEVELLGRMEFIEEGIEIVKFVSNDKGQLILADFGDSM